MGTNVFVGRTIKVIEDINRKEIFEEGQKHRTFPISIFYPAEVTVPKNESNLTTLFAPAVKEVIDGFAKMGIDEEKLKGISISVYENAKPLQNTSFPVVVFSPGFGIDRDLYIDLITAIVQKGYIVVTVSVPYDSFYTVFPDGKVVLQAERFPDDRSQVLMRMQDARLVLDYLEKWNKEEFFSGIFDTAKIAVMGHSLGGATVYNMAALDDRIRSAILLDASLHIIDDKIPDIPVLNMRQDAASYTEYLNAIKDEENTARSEAIAKLYIENQTKMYNHLPSGSSFVKIKDAGHLSFSTIGRLISDVPSEVIIAIQESTVAFLNEFLKEEDGAYLETINGINKPSNLVVIDGSGLSVNKIS